MGIKHQNPPSQRSPPSPPPPPRRSLPLPHPAWRRPSRSPDRPWLSNRPSPSFDAKMWERWMALGGQLIFKMVLRWLFSLLQGRAVLKMMYIWVFGDMQTVLNLNEIVWKKRCFLTYYKPEIHKHGSMALHSAKRQLFQTISRAPDTNRPREIIRQNYLRRRQPSGTPWETECHKRPLEIRYTKMDDFFAFHFGGSRWSCSIWKNRCSFPNPRSSIAKKLNSHHWNSTLKGVWVGHWASPNPYGAA